MVIDAFCRSSSAKGSFFPSFLPYISFPFLSPYFFSSHHICFLDVPMSFMFTHLSSTSHLAHAAMPWFAVSSLSTVGWIHKHPGPCGTFVQSPALLWLAHFSFQSFHFPWGVVFWMLPKVLGLRLWFLHAGVDHCVDHSNSFSKMNQRCSSISLWHTTTIFTMHLVTQEVHWNGMQIFVYLYSKHSIMCWYVL